MSHKSNSILYVLWLIIFTSSASAEDIRYVTDELEVTIHRSMSLSSDIVTQLKSGTPVKVIKSKSDEGYVMVATGDEKVGWMLESYLLTEPSAREQYQVLKVEYEKLKSDFDKQLEEKTATLSSELSKVKSISKRPLELQKENQYLKNTIEEERAQVEVIRQENKQFKSIHKDRQWFVAGALTAIGSLLLGLIITRIPWRKRKGWGEL